MAVQQDFGGFDPSFLGVTIRFGNERSWRIYDDALASTQPLPIPAGSNPDEQFERISITSVLSHEVRHFHDFFLTSYSAYLFRLRIQLLLNVLELLPSLVGDTVRYNCVPVPISKWCVLPDSDRSARLSKLPPRADGKPWVSVGLPYLDQEALESAPGPKILSGSPEAVQKLMAAAIRGQARIHDLTYNPTTVSDTASFQPWQVFELSGLLVQMQEIWHYYGVKETENFTNYLISSRTPYGAMLRVMRHMWGKMQLPFDTRLTSAMVSWSLLGSYERDSWKACPTERFVRLWTHLLERGIPRPAGRLTSLFDDWSKATELSTVDEGLHDTLSTFRRAHDAVRDFAKVKESFAAESFGPFLVEVLDAVAKTSEHMIAAFRRNPDRYVYPDLYIQEISSFANPSIRLLADGGFIHFDSPRETRDKKGYIVEWAIQENGEDLIASMIAPCSLSNHAFLRARDVQKLSAMISLTDFLFAAKARARIDIQRSGRVWFSAAELRPVEILH